MWKIFAAFIVFALAALFVIMKGGDKVDMQGEAGHGTPSSSHEASAPAAPAAPGAAPTAPAAPAASAPESSTPPASGAAPAASK
jgi:hypothetical protein